MSAAEAMANGVVEEAGRTDDEIRKVRKKIFKLIVSNYICAKLYQQDKSKTAFSAYATTYHS